MKIPREYLFFVFFFQFIIAIQESLFDKIYGEGNTWVSSYLRTNLLIKRERERERKTWSKLR